MLDIVTATVRRRATLALAVACLPLACAAQTTGQVLARRLLARPTATLSLEAQQRRELKQKMFGD